MRINHLPCSNFYYTTFTILTHNIACYITLSQVMVLNASKQSLSQGLEVERAAKEKARGEARELGQKLQSYRTSLQVHVCVCCSK